jgi:hypothetical protein
MRVIGLLVLVSMARGVVGMGGQFYQHKSDGDLARMTPEQQVDEYCNEYVRHGLGHSDYSDLIRKYINLHAIRAVVRLAEIVNQYDPTGRGKSSREKADRAYQATVLLPMIDANVVRLRASAEGRTAILAMKQLSQNMLAAHFDKDEDNDQNRPRYELLISSVEELEGVTDCDQAIENTLRLRYKIHLSEGELVRFVDYLITEDPYYPAWSTREEYKDLTQRNEAGNPIWYLIMKKPEPFYKAYLQFKAKSK